MTGIWTAEIGAVPAAVDHRGGRPHGVTRLLGAFEQIADPCAVVRIVPD